jgi:FMN reductase [NAD(P)H]
MEFKEILSRRRMVRAYEPEPVPREAIERIVATVRRAPSAGFSQGQRLLVVTSQETREEISRVLGGERPAGAPSADAWIENAAVLIVVGIREDDYHDR